MLRQSRWATAEVGVSFNLGPHAAIGLEQPVTAVVIFSTRPCTSLGSASAFSAKFLLLLQPSARVRSIVICGDRG